MVIKKGDLVKAGDDLFCDKNNNQVRFTSPVSGTVSDIVRGDKRKIMKVVVEADSEIKYRNFEKRNFITI